MGRIRKGTQLAANTSTSANLKLMVALGSSEQMNPALGSPRSIVRGLYAHCGRGRHAHYQCFGQLDFKSIVKKRMAVDCHNESMAEFNSGQKGEERVMGLEPTTTSLATRYSTTELHPRLSIENNMLGDQGIKRNHGEIFRSFADWRFDIFALENEFRAFPLVIRNRFPRFQLRSCIPPCLDIQKHVPFP